MTEEMTEERRKEVIKDIATEEQELQNLLDQKMEMVKNLEDIEAKIYRLETNYLEETKNTGNVVKGFDNYLTDPPAASTNPYHPSNVLKRKGGHVNPEDRIFTNSASRPTEHLEKRALSQICSTPIKSHLEVKTERIKQSSPMVIRLPNPKLVKLNNHLRAEKGMSPQTPRIKLKIKTPLNLGENDVDVDVGDK